MQIKNTQFPKHFLCLLFWLIAFPSSGQSNYEKKQIQTVFDQLVTAYGNAKSKPQLIIFKSSTKRILPAQYAPIPKPNIQVDGTLVSVFKNFGKDSLNALAVILSHELAHYYSDHTFCSDYAYALKDQNKSLSGLLKSLSKEDKISKETEADQKGFFYAAAAGFSPFGIQSLVLDKIYEEYNLSDTIPDYPTKEERKSIAFIAEEKAKGLFSIFKTGLEAMAEENYSEAIKSFEEANSYIPFRENYNNMGVARVLLALRLKDPDSVEIEFPSRFLYPLEIDNQSRLMKGKVRGVDFNKKEQLEQLLKLAKTNIQEAIRLDPGYTKSYINLACVFVLLNNQDMAIGIIKDLPLEFQRSKEALRILAIAYYQSGRLEVAEKTWEILEKENLD